MCVKEGGGGNLLWHFFLTFMLCLIFFASFCSNFFNIEKQDVDSGKHSL